MPTSPTYRRVATGTPSAAASRAATPVAPLDSPRRGSGAARVSRAGIMRMLRQHVGVGLTLFVFVNVLALMIAWGTVSNKPSTSGMQSTTAEPLTRVDEGSNANRDKPSAWNELDKLFNPSPAPEPGTPSSPPEVLPSMAPGEETSAPLPPETPSQEPGMPDVSPLPSEPAIGTPAGWRPTTSATSAAHAHPSSWASNSGTPHTSMSPVQSASSVPPATSEPPHVWPSASSSSSSSSSTLTRTATATPSPSRSSTPSTPATPTPTPSASQPVPQAPAEVWKAGAPYAASQVKPVKSAHNDEVLVMADEFNTLDLSFWRHEITMGGGGNGEFQMYVNNRTNSYVRDGILYIRPRFTADWIGEANVQNGFTMDISGTDPASICTSGMWNGCRKTSSTYGGIINPITSARMRTAETFAMKYGRVEVRAKLPIGDWLWPAIWMLPAKQTYGTWPASGEIDIMESRGNPPSYAAEGIDTYGATLHWGPNYFYNRYFFTTGSHKLPEGEDYSQDFHVYGLYWDSEQLYMYLDQDDAEHRVLTVNFQSQSMWQRGRFPASMDNTWKVSPNNAAPFDQPFYFIFNVAVGGTSGYFPPGVGNRPWGAAREFWAARNQWLPTWDDEKTAMAIDYIRVWQRPSVAGTEVWPPSWGYAPYFNA